MKPKIKITLVAQLGNCGCHYGHKVGDSFDPKAGVTVKDEDENIELVVESNVNTNIPAIWRLLAGRKVW